jgi:hypothetical protein
LHAATNFAAAGLPKGLHVSSATGEIIGMPTKAGTSTISLIASNANGAAEETLALTVTPYAPQPPSVTSPGTAEGTVGSPFRYQITGTGAPTHFFATSPSDLGTVPPESNLPAGLSYDVLSGVLSGIPRVAGFYSIQVAASNESGIGFRLVTLTVKGK